MVLLEPDPFLNELTRLYERNKGGTVWITMKRTNLKARKGKKSALHKDYFCLIRATDGKRKISTTVPSEHHARFQMSFGTVLKAHMDSLKKAVKQRMKKADSAKNLAAAAAAPKA